MSKPNVKVAVVRGESFNRFPLVLVGEMRVVGVRLTGLPPTRGTDVAAVRGLGNHERDLELFPVIVREAFDGEPVLCGILVFLEEIVVLIANVERNVAAAVAPVYNRRLKGSISGAQRK